MFILIDVRNGSTPLSDARYEDYSVYSTDTWLSVQRKNIVASIRTRHVYPRTFCERQPDGSIMMGYGSRRAQLEDEFLHITLSNDGSIYIQRDVQCVLPIFYGQCDDVFVLSNDYREVVERLPGLTLNRENLCKTLLNVTPVRQYTFWNEIHVLGERQALYIKQGETTYAPTTPPRPWTFSTELAEANPRAFPDVIEDKFRYFIDTRLKNSNVGFELSGGLDSAFLPLFIAANGYNTPAPAGTLVQPQPEDKTRQLQKIAQIEACTPLRSKLVYLNPEYHYPLVEMISKDTFYPVDHAHDPYISPTIEIADYFQSLGVTVVATGWGGDQLLEHRPHPNVIHEQHDKPIAPFLTRACRAVPRKPNPYDAVPTFLSSALLYESLAQANTYIERDMWPVSPFHDVWLFNFCQALPIQYRTNKNIFRAYFAANEFPAALYEGPNEYFSTFFNMCMLSGKYDRLIEQLAAHSVTATLGYTDVSKLMTLFSSIRRGTASSDGLFSIYTWIRTELSLQYTPKWSVK